MKPLAKTKKIMIGKIEIFIKNIDGRNYLMPKYINNDPDYYTDASEIEYFYKKIKSKLRNYDLCAGISDGVCWLIIKEQCASASFEDLMSPGLANNDKIVWTKSERFRPFSDNKFLRDFICRMLAVWKLEHGKRIAVLGLIPKTIQNWKEE